MGKKKKEKLDYKSINATYIPKPTGKEYSAYLDSDEKRSLIPDPEGKLGLSDEDKRFISFYCQYKNLQYVSLLMGMDVEDVTQKFMNRQAISDEISRINTAMYHRMFSRKQASLDQIGGYLTSLLTDDGVAFSDRLPSSDKVKVASLLIDLNKYKEQTYKDPELIDNSKIEEQIKTLSVDSIKQLLYVNSNRSSVQTEIAKKEAIMDKMEKENKGADGKPHKFTPSEKDELRGMSTDELVSMLNEVSKKH